MQLRKWKMSDAQPIVKYADNPRIADNLRDMFPKPYTLNDAYEFIKSCEKNCESKQCVRAIDVDGEAVGCVGVFVQDDVYSRSAEIGYWLAEPFWRRGIMTQAVIEMTEYAFNNYDIVRLYAEIFAYNNGSRRVLEKAGYQFEGTLRSHIFKNGKVYDGLLFARVRS